MTDTRISQAAWDRLDSFEETKQAAADQFVAIQDQNLKFTQQLFLTGITLLEDQIENTRSLTQWWTQQLSQQQQAFHTMMHTVLDVYGDFLHLPFTYAQAFVNATTAQTPQMFATLATAAQREHAQVWTFEHPLQEADNQRPVVIRTKGPGMVHAGVNRSGKWIRMYDVTLREVSPGVWEAFLLDPEVNEFTFIWYDSNQSGGVHWEGKNYLLPRRPVSAGNSEWPGEKSIKHFLDQTEIV